MQLSITARHFDLTEGLKEHTEERVQKLTKYGLDILEAHAVLMVEKYRHMVEVTLHSKGLNVTGKAESDDMYTSVDQAVNKVEEQIRRHKDRMKGHKSKVTRRSGVRFDVLRTKSDKTGAQIDVVRSGELEIPTLTVEEAILELEKGGDDYVLFTNPITDKVNILSKREDGNYGVVET